MKIILSILICALFICAAAFAADNTLTDKEKADGWKLLFDGTSLTGWKDTGKTPTWSVQDGIVGPTGKGGNLQTKEAYGNFIVSVDFKEDVKTNSGLFLRIPAKPTKGCRGIEIQIVDKSAKDSVGKHACGSVYDAVAPTKAMCKAAGVWQTLMVDCRDNMIKVTLNGELVTTMNLDEWNVAGKAPDGSPNKFTVAYKDMPRVGNLGLQNHGTKVWFKNIKIKVLDKSAK